MMAVTQIPSMNDNLRIYLWENMIGCLFLRIKIHRVSLMKRACLHSVELAGRYLS